MGVYRRSRVKSDDIKDLSVSTIDVGPLQITNAKLAGSAVTEPKIAAKAITTNKGSPNFVTNALLAGSAVQTANIAAGNVTANKLAGSAVTAAKVAAGAITANKLKRLTQGSVVTSGAYYTFPIAYTTLLSAVATRTIGSPIYANNPVYISNRKAGSLKVNGGSPSESLLVVVVGDV